MEVRGREPRRVARAVLVAPVHKDALDLLLELGRGQMPLEQPVDRRREARDRRRREHAARSQHPSGLG
jgi:hypothetical protein